MREVININKNWLFSKKEQPVPKTLPEDWESVNLPHMERHRRSGRRKRLLQGQMLLCKAA